jgi:hypothetical protein
VRSDSEVDGRVVEAVLLRYVCVFVFMYVSMYRTLFFSAIHTHKHTRVHLELFDEPDNERYILACNRQVQQRVAVLASCRKVSAVLQKMLEARHVSYIYTYTYNIYIYIHIYIVS